MLASCLAPFLAFHVWLVTHNRTTIEKMETHKKIEKNCKELFLRRGAVVELIERPNAALARIMYGVGQAEVERLESRTPCGQMRPGSETESGEGDGDSEHSENEFEGTMSLSLEEVASRAMRRRLLRWRKRLKA